MWKTIKCINYSSVNSIACLTLSLPDFSSLRHCADVQIVLFSLKAKRVTMGADRVGNTLLVISINQKKLLKGFKKLKWEEEDFNR